MDASLHKRLIVFLEMEQAKGDKEKLMSPVSQVFTNVDEGFYLGTF